MHGTTQARTCGVSLATAGLLLATGATIVVASGTQLWQLGLAVVTVALTAQGKLHPAAMIVVGGPSGWPWVARDRLATGGNDRGYCGGNAWPN